MRPQTRTITTLAADPDGLVTTLAAPATIVVLNGAFVASGVGTMPAYGRVAVTSDADDSGITFTITGTDALNNSQSETITGPSTATVYTTLDYKTVTAITVSAATTGNITSGSIDVSSSVPVLLDHYGRGACYLTCEVISGSPVYTVQETAENLYVTAQPRTWFNSNDTAVVGATASQQSNYLIKPLATRLTITSGTGVVKYTVMDSGPLSV